MELLEFQKSRFSRTEKIIQYQKKLKAIQNLNVNHFSRNFNKFGIFFWFFTETLTLLLTVTRWAGGNTDLQSDRNILEMI